MPNRIVRRRVPNANTPRPHVVMSPHTIVTPRGLAFAGRKCTVIALLAIPDRDADRSVGHVMLSRGIDGERLATADASTDAPDAEYGAHWWRLYGSPLALGQFLKHPAVKRWHSELSIAVPTRAAGGAPAR